MLAAALPLIDVRAETNALPASVTCSISRVIALFASAVTVLRSTTASEAATFTFRSVESLVRAKPFTIA